VLRLRMTSPPAGDQRLDGFAHYDAAVGKIAVTAASRQEHGSRYRCHQRTHGNAQLGLFLSIGRHYRGDGVFEKGMDAGSGGGGIANRPRVRLYTGIVEPEQEETIHAEGRDLVSREIERSFRYSKQAHFGGAVLWELGFQSVDEIHHLAIPDRKEQGVAVREIAVDHARRIACVTGPERDAELIGLFHRRTMRALQMLRGYPARSWTGGQVLSIGWHFPHPLHPDRKQPIMLRVHHLNDSRAQKTVWLLEELALPYDLVPYERHAVTTVAPAVLKALHPVGKSPMIEDNGHVVIESGAITDHIIERLGDGLPVLAATIQRHVLTPRLGIPADVAALAAFLAADESGRRLVIPSDGSRRRPLPR
jgi:hypothetical protein